MAATTAGPPAPQAGPSFQFHWTAEGITDPAWVDTFLDIAKKAGGVNISTAGADRVGAAFDETTLELRVRNATGKARGSLAKVKGCWKAALVLLALGRHFTVAVVDDDSNDVTVRSLRKQTNLGFAEEEYASLAERLGLIDRTMEKDPLFAQFF